MEGLALHIFDIAKNSLKNGASKIDINLLENPNQNLLVIEVRDDRPGRESKVHARATTPFPIPGFTRRNGRGLPHLAAASREAGGSMSINSRAGKGYRIRATFQYGHVNRPPIGDLETALTILLAENPDKDIHFRHYVVGHVFELDSREIRAAGFDLDSSKGLAELRKIIRKGETGLPTNLTSPKAD